MSCFGKYLENPQTEMAMRDIGGSCIIKIQDAAKIVSQQFGISNRSCLIDKKVSKLNLLPIFVQRNPWKNNMLW